MASNFQAELTRSLFGMGLELAKASPGIGMVHHDRPLEVKADDEEKDDDPGTQDVDPPDQSAISAAPLDIIIPQTVMKTISGSSPIGLNAEGRELADNLADRVAVKGCLDIIYSSTLPRGIETVKPILKACPNTVYAGASKDLVPWRLGAYEGEEPGDVQSQITALIENPDEVPPGECADGGEPESFNHAKARQLGFFQKLYADYTDDPTLKIGAQVHSRGLELLIAWVAADCPDDYDIDDGDVIDPDDAPHASVMRWHRDDVKEVDLDSDDPLKPGVYLILHSLTDDDGDSGNPELEKFDADQPRDDKGRFGSGQVELGVAQDEHDRLKEHPGRQLNPSSAAQSNFERGVTALGSRVRALAAKPAFNVKINRSGDKARAAILNHADMGDKAVSDARGSDRGYMMDMALSHYHDALLTAGRVLGSKWVGKAFNPDQPRDDHGRWGAFGKGLKNLQDAHDRLKEHRGRELNASDASVSALARGIESLGRKTSELKDSANAKDDESVRAAAKFIGWGDAHLQSSYGATDDRIRSVNLDNALSNYHSAISNLGRLVNSKWIGKSARHHTYMPPLDVHRAAKSAWDNGVSVIGITDALAESRGLDYESVLRVAEFFRASESATMTAGQRNAYGGVNAAKWADKVIAKARMWEPYTAVDFDGTLVKPSESYDGTAIGAPIPAMVAKVKALLDAGTKVRIFTARVADDPDGKKAEAIKVWCREHLGRELPVTNEKDPGMTELWDDRARNPDDISKAGSGVMVAFMLDAATADRLKVEGGEKPDDMHVTLAYLGKQDALDKDVQPRLEKVVKAYAAEHAPVSSTIDGPVRFSAKPQTEGRDVCVAAFCNPGVQEFRAGLVDAIKASGVDVPRVFDYRPHVCLKYIAPDADMPVQRIAPIPVTFKAITLVVGGKRTNYSLSGDVVKYSPDQPRDEHGRWGSGQDNEALANEFPLAGSKADGLTVLSRVDSTDSIESSLEDYTIVPGIREVKFSDFPNHVPNPGKTTGYDARDNQRAKDLAARIKESGEISPLIVVVDHEGPYILEGAHRFDALDYMGHKSFPAMVVVDNDAIERHSVTKYSPDQPRAADGEWGAGGGRPKVSARVERARKSCVIIGTKEQGIADKAEQKLSDALGVPRTRNNSAFDLRNDEVGIECKCLLVGAHEKITMSKTALARKVAEQRDNDLRGYTVVADMRGGRARASYYYKEGFGSFRLGSMIKVTLPELRNIVR